MVSPVPAVLVLAIRAAMSRHSASIFRAESALIAARRLSAYVVCMLNRVPRPKDCVRELAAGMIEWIVDGVGCQIDMLQQNESGAVQSSGRPCRALGRASRSVQNSTPSLLRASATTSTATRTSLQVASWSTTCRRPRCASWGDVGGDLASRCAPRRCGPI